MYDTGNAGFLAAVCNPNRNILASATIHAASVFGPGVIIPEHSWKLDANSIASYKITGSSVAGKIFAPGSFVASQLEMSLVASSPEATQVNFKSHKNYDIIVYAGIQVDHMVNVPLGKFYLDDDGVNSSDDGYINITAINIPAVLNEQFDSSILSLPCTVAEALEKISTVTGIPIVMPTAEVFPNIGIQLLETFSLLSTYRDALSYIAEAIGAYVFMDRVGNIQLRKVFSGLVDIGCVLDDNYLFSVDKQESSVKPFQYISIKANKDDIGVTHTVSDVTTGCEYDIIDNPLTYGHPEEFLEGLVNPLTFSEFYPSKISFHGRPDLDLGDVVTYIYKGVSYILPICTHVFEYSGGFKSTLESIGSDVLKVYSADTGTKLQINALKQNVNTLIRDLLQTVSRLDAIDGDIAKFSEVKQTAETLSSKISAVEGDVAKLSTLTQTAEGLSLSIETLKGSLKDANDKINNNQATILSYFDFQADGLVIGLSSSKIKLKLMNDKIQFLKEGSSDPVAYFSEGKLYVTDAHFLKSLVLGNFEFTPRTNGNLSLRYRG